MKLSDTIPAQIYRHVQSRPEKPSIRFRDISSLNSGVDTILSYGDLWIQASGLAAQLDLVNSADHVIVVMPLCPQLLVAHLAVLLRGAVVSIFAHPSEKISSDVYAAKLHHAVTAFHPRAIITTELFLNAVREATTGVNLDVVLFPTAVSPGNSSDPWKLRPPSATAIVQYSSGSTGMQKAVSLTHEMVIGQCESYARAIDLSPDTDIVCSWLPLYHDMGLFTSWLMPVLHGVTVALIDPFQWVKKPQSLFRLIGDVKGTVCWLPNFAFNLLAQRIRGDLRTGLDVSSMRGFVNCSEPVSAASMELFLTEFSGIGVRRSMLWTCYAMAENSFAVSSATGEIAALNTIRIDAAALGGGIVKVNSDGSGIAMVSCGRPITGTEIAILGLERELVAPDRVGEITLKSPYMLKEYFKNPATTAAAIDLDGWYHTGDLGFMREGNLYITGRKKDLLIIGGRNFYPQDIERICDGLSGCIPGRSVALGIMDDNMGTEKAILLIESTLVSESEKARLSTQVRKAVFDELDCPIADIRIVPHMWLLKTSSGKIARKPNLDKYQRELAPQEGLSAGAQNHREPINWLLMTVWSLILGITIYITPLMFGRINNSWNIYMRF